jgi:ATP-binding cassette subfamily F protein 3
VLRIDGLSKSYDGRVVFGEVDLQLSRGDKVAVVGVNGAGKSTFLRIMAGEIAADSGEIKFGTNVRMSYFGQHQALELSPQLTVFETLNFATEDMTVTRIRSLLGAFLFRGEDVEKKVSVLSGGEKSRLALAKMIAIPANCMLLDEPTNHLDMSSQEVLQEAMAQYDGTIVVVSHNRYFLDSFVNKVLEVRNGHIALYEGNIADYLYKQELLQQQTLLQNEKEAATGAAKNSDNQDSRKERKRIEAQKRQERSKLAGPWLKQLEEAEQKVDALEKKKVELEALMADPELYGDRDKWAQVSKEYEEADRRLTRWYGKWETAQQKIEEIDALLKD